MNSAWLYGLIFGFVLVLAVKVKRLWRHKKLTGMPADQSAIEISQVLEAYAKNRAMELSDETAARLSKATGLPYDQVRLIYRAGGYGFPPLD